jgi:hypothetical protein
MIKARLAIALFTLCFALPLRLVHAQPTNPAAPVYLFSTFKEGEQDGLRFAFSYDGYSWSNIPGVFLKPHVDGKIMRDPSILRGPDGTWHLVWTTAWRGNSGFGYAHSKDLVHWSEQQFIPVMAHEPTVCNVWAPEIFYDDGSWRSSRGNEAQTKIGNDSKPPHVGCYVIVWASTIPGRFPDHLEPSTNNHRMYFTTTRDFKTFTPTKLFLDPDFSVIDCQILQDADHYVLLLKDNTRPQRNLRVAFGDTPLGPWRDISTNLTANFTEGPCGLKIGDDWLIYYSSMKTRDFKTFTDVTGEMTFPPELKHGTAFKISRELFQRLLQTTTDKSY